MTVRHIFIFLMIQINDANAAKPDYSSLSYQRIRKICELTIDARKCGIGPEIWTTRLSQGRYTEGALRGCTFNRITIRVFHRDDSTMRITKSRGIESPNIEAPLFYYCPAIPLDGSPGDWSRTIKGTPEELARFLLTENKNPQ